MYDAAGELTEDSGLAVDYEYTISVRYLIDTISFIAINAQATDASNAPTFVILKPS